MDPSIELLIADADASVRDILRYCVRDEGWSSDDAKDGISALKLLRKKQYHLVLLDTELPEISGELVCAQIRKNSRVPVIFLSKKTSEDDRLVCFMAGGNDFVIKPFFPREVMARIKSFLILSGAEPSRKALRSGNLLIKMYSRAVMMDNREIKLTPKEYDLLLFFCQNSDKTFSRDDILDFVWGKYFSGSYRTVDTHVKSLRSKIRPYHNYIVTIWGYGYKYNVPLKYDEDC